jgi:hypothetical protein
MLKKLLISLLIATSINAHATETVVIKSTTNRGETNIGDYWIAEDLNLAFNELGYNSEVGYELYTRFSRPCKISIGTSETIHQLDEKFIPNAIPKIETAEVGQAIVVKSVDENGKPIEWETATFSTVAIDEINALFQ